MKLSVWGKSVLCLSVAATLTACGGGGGGSDDGKEVQQSALTLDSNNYAATAMRISPDSEVDAVLALYQDVGAGGQLIAELRTALAAQSSGVSGSTDCAGGGTATVEYAGVDPDDDERWRFDNCVVSTASFEDVQISGTYRYVDKLTAKTDSSGTWQGYERFSLTGKVVTNGAPLAIRGSGDWDNTLRLNSEGDVDAAELRDRVEVLEMRVGDRYVALMNGEVTTTLASSGLSYAMKARLVGSAIGGFVDITTPTALVIPASDGCTTEGVMRLEGDGYVEVRYGISTGTGEAVVVEINGSRARGSDDCKGYVPVI